MIQQAAARNGMPKPSSTTYFLPASVAQQQKKMERGQQMIARRTAMTNPIVGPEIERDRKVRITCIPEVD